jgi:hypothetical protein
LVPSTSIRLSTTSLSSPIDLRDVQFDPMDSTRMFVLVRGVQQTVEFLRLDPGSLFEARAEPPAVRVGAGPSKLRTATLDEQLFLFVSAYNAGTIEIIDAQSQQMISLVRGLSGPFDMVVDETRKLLYVADFRASVLRVIDLSGLTDRSLPPPRVVATVGTPRFAQGPT